MNIKDLICLTAAVLLATAPAMALDVGLSLSPLFHFKNNGSVTVGVVVLPIDANVRVTVNLKQVHGFKVAAKATTTVVIGLTGVVGELTGVPFRLMVATIDGVRSIDVTVPLNGTVFFFPGSVGLCAAVGNDKNQTCFSD